MLARDELRPAQQAGAHSLSGDELMPDALPEPTEGEAEGADAHRQMVMFNDTDIDIENKDEPELIATVERKLN